jgi:hypothetical protein
MLKALMLLIRLLPEVIKLIENMEKRIDEEKTFRRLEGDIKNINLAFETNDEHLLNSVFNGVPVSPKDADES